MKYEAEIREHLIDNAIRLIAEGGFEAATTKELAHSGTPLEHCRMNEVYIYRFFGSKEALFEAAFLRLDREIYDAFFKGVAAVADRTLGRKERMYRFFQMAWSFVLRSEERCRCYVRYYYSIYFKGASLEAHQKLFGGMIADLTPLFKKEADVFSILHSVFTSLLDFAVRVYNGDLEDNEENRPHVFNVLYCMMATYFAEEKTA